MLILTAFQIIIALVHFPASQDAPAAPSAGEYAVDVNQSARPTRAPGTEQNRDLINRLQNRVEGNIETIYQLRLKLWERLNARRNRAGPPDPPPPPPPPPRPLPPPPYYGEVLTLRLLTEQKSSIKVLIKQLSEQSKLIDRLRRRILSLDKQ